MIVGIILIGFILIMWFFGVGVDVMKFIVVFVIGGVIIFVIYVLIVMLVIFVMVKECVFKKGML